jgi:hypothetical protein
MAQCIPFYYKRNVKIKITLFDRVPRRLGILENLNPSIYHRLYKLITVKLHNHTNLFIFLLYILKFIITQNLSIK